MCVCVSCVSRSVVSDSVTPWTPLSIGLIRVKSRVHTPSLLSFEKTFIYI